MKKWGKEMEGKEYGSTPSSWSKVFCRRKHIPVLNLQSVKHPSSALWAFQQMCSPNRRQAHSLLWICNFQEKLPPLTKIRQYFF